jgi:hypothetical protein
VIAIYVLVDPETERVRYVGRTDNPRRRFNDHCSINKNTVVNEPLQDWILGLRSKGLKPTLKIVEETTSELAPAIERMYISDHIRKGDPILNNPYKVKKVTPDEAVNRAYIAVRSLLFNVQDGGCIGNEGLNVLCAASDVLGRLLIPAEEARGWSPSKRGGSRGGGRPKKTTSTT